MQKIFITLCLALGICAFAKAQNRSNGIEIGIGVGYNYSFVIETSTPNSTKGKSGFNLSLSAEKYFSDEWGLKIRPGFDQKGWGKGFVQTPTGTMYDVDFTLGYITVPVMANWHFGNTRNWYLNFGPYVGILTSATAAGYDLKSGFNTSDIGLDLGGGFKLPIGGGRKFYVEYDAQAGAIGIFNNSGASASSNSIRNSRSSFNIGLTF